MEAEIGPGRDARRRSRVFPHRASAIRCPTAPAARGSPPSRTRHDWWWLEARREIRISRTPQHRQPDAMMRTLPSIARIHSSRAATPVGSALSSSSGQVPPPPGADQQIERLPPRPVEIPVRRHQGAVDDFDICHGPADQRDFERIGRRRRVAGAKKACDRKGLEEAPDVDRLDQSSCRSAGSGGMWTGLPSDRSYY